MSNQPFVPRGGIDLAALAAQREAAERSAATRAVAPEGVIVEATEANFQTEVIERSMTVPVIVDFRGAWSTPGLQLSPVIEKVVAESGGRLVLASVDVDAHPRIGQAFRVQALPAVFAVIGGQPLPLPFEGPVPESQVQMLFAEVLKAAEQAGVTGRVGGVPEAAEEVAEVDDVDPLFDVAADAIDRGDWAAAIAAYDTILAASPTDEYALAARSQVRLMERTEGVDLEAALAAVAADPADVAAACLAADAAVMAGDLAAAFALLVEAVRLNSGEERGEARTHLLDLFEIVGLDNPAIGPARLALSNALF